MKRANIAQICLLDNVSICHRFKNLSLEIVKTEMVDSCRIVVRDCPILMINHCSIFLKDKYNKVSCAVVDLVA